jgi:outer membrane protein OmpA-like peptidoglycan-associated protein
VLLPNPDGSIGEIEVVSQKGSQTLTEANQSTRVTNLKSKPSSPEILSDNVIASTFGEVIAIEPTHPEKYILYFKFDSTALAPQSENILPTIIESLKNRRPLETEIVVSGHSDRVGNKEYNIILSLKRAKSVKNKLSSMGARDFIIDVTSHGEGNPLIKTADNVSEPRNRRVEVIVK